MFGGGGGAGGFEWSQIDGSRGAPTGAAQRSTLLAGYVARPPWSVAAVGYSVGYPSGQVFKDPQTDALPSGVTVNTTSHLVTVTGNNVTLDGWDFSLHGGYSLNLASGSGPTTIVNCNFKVGANLNYQINSPAGSGAVTITKSKFDGNSTNDASSFQDALNYSGPGPVVFQYNWVLNQFQHGIDFGGTGAGSSVTPDVRFNLFENIGTGALTHADAWYYFNVNMVSGIFRFNTIYQPQTVNTPANPGMFVGTDNFTTGITTSNTDASNNVVIATGPAQSMTYPFWMQNSAGNTLTGCSMNNNYYDNTACDGVFKTSGDYGTNPKAPGNIDMKTGLVATPPF